MSVFGSHVGGGGLRRWTAGRCFPWSQDGGRGFPWSLGDRVVSSAGAARAFRGRFPWSCDVFPWRRRPDGVEGRDELGIELARIIKEIVDVEEGLVGVEPEDVVPSSREVVVVGERGHGGEGIIEDGVVTWSDLPCANVEDERDEGRVVRGESHEHSKASPRQPLGDGFAVGNVVVKHVDRATEDVGAGEAVVTEAIAGPEFRRADA